MEKIEDYPFNIPEPLMKVTTSSEIAQKWFGYALNWHYGFNFEEVMECCKRALKEDPQCGMAYYLAGMSVGINYNYFPEMLMPEQVKAQYEFWKKADRVKNNLSEMEQDIIDAFKFRAGDGESLVHVEFDQQYANQMGVVYNKYEKKYEDKLLGDQEFCFLAELYAESMMVLTPWKMWVQIPKNENEKCGDPYKNTMRINYVLEKTLKIMPNHIGLRHLYIHLHELSLTPEISQCDKFPNLLREIGKEIGHLNHMPSHIDVMCGKYWDAITCNIMGVNSNEKYMAYREKEGMPKMCSYIFYCSHNIHSLVYAAMFQGNYKIAQEEAMKIFKLFDHDFMMKIRQSPMIGTMETFLPIIVHVLIRFGKWEQLVEDPYFGVYNEAFLLEHKDFYQSTLCSYYYGKAIAYAVMAGKIEGKYDEYLQKALENEKQFLQVYESIELNRRTFGNPMKDIMGVGIEMVRGEILYRQKKYQQAFEHLRNSVDRYDRLHYEEPWGWMMPPRHALAALTLEQGIQQKNQQLVLIAEKEYKQDIGQLGGLRCVVHPDNIWSLIGLKICNKQLGRIVDEKLEKKIKKQLEHSDIEINASCLCSLRKVL